MRGKLLKWQPQRGMRNRSLRIERAIAFPPASSAIFYGLPSASFDPANPIILFQHLAKTYGDIAHYKIGPHHIVFLNHPDYIREVLVVQNDNFIKERTVQRTKMLLGEGMITAEGSAHRGATAGGSARVPPATYRRIWRRHCGRISPTPRFVEGRRTP